MTGCPKCRGRALSPVILDENLPAKGCKACGGVLLDLLAYRLWADRKGVDSVESGATSATGVATNAMSSAASAQEVADTTQAIPCPNCTAVMTKFRVVASAGNKLDYCPQCDEVWLDSGEWQQLEDLGLRRSLGSVFTEPWQRHVRAEISEKMHESRLREWFGADYDRVADFRAWAQAHPSYEKILAWLRDRGGA